MKRTEVALKNNDVWFAGEAFGDLGTDPEFQEIARHFLCGDILSEAVLSDKQKALVMLTALTTCQTFGVLGQYAQAALRVGTSAAEIRETLYQCAPYIGLEKVHLALVEVEKAFCAQGVAKTDKQGTVREESRLADGLAVQQHIFGVENINNMRAAAPDDLKKMQDYLSAWCFGDFYTRGTLDVAMRELVTFTAICCLGGCEPQAKAHAGANLSVGNSRAMLLAALIQCLPLIGFPRTLNGIACVDAVTQA